MTFKLSLRDIRRYGILFVAVLLVFAGAGCWTRPGSEQTATSTPYATSTSPASGLPSVTSTSSVESAPGTITPLAFQGDQQTFRRACRLSIEQLPSLIQPTPELRPLQNVIDTQKKDGWQLTELCLDKDVWVIGERDAVETVYFSLSKPASDAAHLQVVMGVWVMDGGIVRLSKPVVIGISGNVTNGFTMLDLEKHYNASRQVIPTVHAHLDFLGADYSYRESYEFGPKDMMPRKTFSCSRTEDVKTGNVVSDTCKDKMD